MIPRNSRAKGDFTDTLNSIKKANPSFNEDTIYKYTEIAIKSIYTDLKNNAQLIHDINCKEDVIKNILKNKKKYRITEDIDVINILYIGLYDCVKNTEGEFVKIRASIYFYDNTKNNKISDNNIKEKCWNDIWLITYQNMDKFKKRKISNCDNCGATMKYDYPSKMFKCEYCGSIKINSIDNINWEIIDIEIEQ